MTTIARAGLLARLTHAPALAALTEAAAWLEAHGCQPVIEQHSADAAEAGTRWATASRDEITDRVDVVIVFGGDGTLLDAASIVARARRDVPMLGVNLGRVGFLTEVSRSELTLALDAVLQRRTRTETRLMLEGRIDRGGEIVARRLALNDIVLTRGALSRMIEIEAAVDGQFVCHVKADGLILATATGSTAYNLSAGGPIVHPSVDAILMTPIAPHAFTNRPLVLPATAEVTLRPLIDPSLSDILLTFDGQHGEPLQADDQVVITRAPRVLQLLRTSARTHFDMLREKLKWGNV
jgi:NAD+ kinase